MKFLDLNDISSEKLEEYINIFETHKELKQFLGGCPKEEYRVNANCFYCDDCWIEAIRSVMKNKEEGK